VQASPKGNFTDCRGFRGIVEREKDLSPPNEVARQKHFFTTDPRKARHVA